MMRPMLKSHLVAHALNGQHVVMLSEDGHHLLSGQPYVEVVSRLDGSLTEDELVERVELDGVHPMAAHLTLRHLEALGVLDERAPDDMPQGQRAYWHSLGARLGAVRQAQRRLEVDVRELGSHGAELRRALERLAVSIQASSGEPRLLIVIADDYLEPTLAHINAQQLASQQPWLLLKLVGTTVWIGPIFLPGSTGCWECLAERLRLNRQTERILAARTGTVRPRQPTSTAAIQLATAVAATEIKLWLSLGKHPGLEGKVGCLDLKRNEFIRHQLVRRPQCKACGCHPAQTMEMFELPAARKECFGSARQLDPEAFVKAYSHHVSPITGVITSLTEHIEDGFCHVTAAQSFPLYRFDFRVLRDNHQGRSGGKGTTLNQAKTGAIAEALERTSGIWQAQDPTITASQRELGERAIELATCLGFSKSQYDNRERWNAINDDPHAWVPNPLDENLPIEWVGFWSLTNQCLKYLPAALAYYGHPDLKHAFCASDSNGCAAGGSPAEAIAHSLLELIERDSVALWWANKVRRPQVALGSITRPFVAQSVQRHRDAGRSIWALDLTSDVGIPVAAAISARSNSAAEDIVYGFGCDFDPQVAVEKAFQELEQTSFWTSKRNADGTGYYRTDRPIALRWFAEATLANQPYLVPAGEVESLSQLWPRTQDWSDDIELCVERLRQLDLEVLVLDQTRPDIGLPVFRVVVPKLCHFWRRFGFSRLYRAPVMLGWLDRQRQEEELNQWNIYF